MKKLYTLIIAAAATLCASAQVELIYKGQTVDPSQTLVITADVMDFGGFIMIDCGEFNGPEVANLSDKDLEVSVTATVEATNTHDLKFCYGGDCSFFNAGEKATQTKTGTIVAGKSEKLFLDAHFDYEEYGEAYATATITANGESKTYNLKYLYSDATAISNITTHNTSNTIYDLTGRRVSQPTAGQIYIKNGHKYLQK